MTPPSMAGSSILGGFPSRPLPPGGQALLHSQELPGCNIHDHTEACVLSPQLGPSGGQRGSPVGGGFSQEVTPTPSGEPHVAVFWK